MSSSTSQVTIMAVGVSNYQHMDNLPGAENDVDRLRELLIESPNTALFEEKQFIEVINPTAEGLRSKITDYVTGISGHGEILLFYFSGHGAPIGGNDFGFCATDTIVHPGNDVILPISVIKFSDLLQTFSVRNITPVIIIDACYSGIAGYALEVSPLEAIQTMRNELHAQYASKYALLTSCTDYQTSIDTTIGGIFSHYLIEIAGGIISSGKPEKKFLNLHDIFPELEARVMSYSGGEVTPRLYLGPTLPEFDLVKNVNYSPRIESLALYQIRILRALWNRGSERELRPGEIGALCGPGAYGNHSKLSLPPWNLVETNPKTKKRRLTKRGKLFLAGKEVVPRQIEIDTQTGEWVPSPKTKYVKVSEFPNLE